MAPLFVLRLPPPTMRGFSQPLTTGFGKTPCFQLPAVMQGKNCARYPLFLSYECVHKCRWQKDG
jgi:hypothetical protein